MANLDVGMFRKGKSILEAKGSDPSHGFQLRGRLAVGFELFRASAPVSVGLCLMRTLGRHR